MQDMLSKNRQKKTTINKGEKSYNATVTNGTAKLIRYFVKRGIKQSVLAEVLNVNKNVIWRIVHNKTFKEV